MKKILFTIVLALCGTAMSGQTFKEWQDPTVNEVNRAPMHTHYFAYAGEDEAAAADKESSANFLTMHGSWKFNWVADSDKRPSGFWNTGFDDNSWDDINVPAIWELNGYGDPIYVNAGYAWNNQFRSNPPELPVAGNHVGSYRKEFIIPASWTGKDVFVHLGSVTSCVYLWVNGKFAGYSEDSKLECEFDVTRLIVPGKENLIAMQVFRWCDGTYLEDQDFFRFSGIARESYMYARSKSRIEDIRVTPELDGQYNDGRLDIALTFKGNPGTAELRLLDADGKLVAETSVKASAKTGAATSFELKSPQKWTAETPYLYTLVASTGGEVIPVKVGFRKVEIKNSQLLVNGKPILIKGADRHELDPDGGYVLSRERMLKDIQIMKEFNLNAVRTCHYPDDNLWYDLCDEYGIYVVAEANIESHGMGYGERTLAKRNDYALAHLQRNKRNVQRGFNHPSIIIWSLGNEAGYGPNFEAAYDWIKSEDKSRPVQYEQAGTQGKTDIFCPMYADYKRIVNYAENPEMTKPLIQCEYAHAMGNSEGGFKEYWDIYRKYDKLQGGFIWDFVDQSIRWKGKGGVTIYAYGGDFNRYDASDANFCDNGLISPDRIPNPHMYEVGYYYQNIWTGADNLKSGYLSVYNENFFRDLSAYRMIWEVLDNGTVVNTGTVEDLDVAPHSTVNVPVAIGDNAICGEGLLNVKYVLKKREGLLPAGHAVASQQFVLKDYDFPSMEMTAGKRFGSTPKAPVIKDGDRNYIIVEGEGFVVEIQKSNGFISRYCVNDKEMLKEGAAITPNFWRAPTDNDFGANLQRRYAVWKNPALTLRRSEGPVSGSVTDGIAVIECKLAIGDFAGMTLKYEINNVGEIKVTEKMTADKSKEISNLFRYGMQVVMPKAFDKVIYYGRGPVENYSDRKSSAFIGKYSQTVDGQFYPYIRPQENGTKSDLRWWTVIDEAGDGLRFTSSEAFSASALHYTIESLDEGLAKANGHSQEVPEADLTNVLVDKVQMGLGCITSWGALPLEEYMLPFGDYEFVFKMTPVLNHIDI